MLEYQRQGRDVVRRIAMLLSGERPLPEILGELAELLGSLYGASVEVVYTDGGANERVYRCGAPSGGGDETRVPAIFAGVTLGELRLRTPAPLDREEVALLEACGVYLGARLHDERRRVRTEELERLAMTDTLTATANRRAFDDKLAREWARARRNGSPLALLMLDVDHFKGYNDAYGHRGGDQCLRAIAEAASACLRRPGDLFARYGGEEFAAVLPETTLDGALVVGESMRAAVESLNMSHGGSAAGCVSVSIGAAHCVPNGPAVPDELVSSADAALYAAKSQGRNRVVAAHTLFPVDYDARNVIGNLPSRPTRFIGHADEVARLAGALEGSPIVTVTGPGGVGKTRVSLEVGRRISGFFPEGVWFINLALLDDGADVIPFVCETLRSVAPLARDAATLASALTDKRLLVLLDSCEHVIEQTASLAQIITGAAPYVRILATSREPLRAQGEVAHRLGSLRVEDAVELFVDRARSAGVTAEDERRATVAAIVQQLDAIPLAIELAAPQLTVMSLDELLRRLDDRLALLEMEIHGAEHRQQTLEAMLDWSHRSLDENARRLFGRLAIFVGGFTRESAMHVCTDDEFNEARLSEALDDLVAKSLVVTDPVATGVRYRMLEITRAYAQRLLLDSKEYDDAARSHVRFFKALAKRFEAMLDAMPVAPWQALVMLDAQNFRAALSLSLDAGDVESVAEICEGLHYWLWEHGSAHASDLTRRIGAMLATPLDPSSEAPLRLTHAALLRNTSRQQALDSAKRAFELYRAQGDVVHVADALRSLGSLQNDVLGTPSPSLAGDMRRYAELMFGRGSTLRAAELLNNLGVCYAQMLEDVRLQDARTCFERAAGLLESRGDGERAGRVTGNSAATAYLLGDVELAVRWSRRAVDLLDRTNPSTSAAHQWSNYGFYLSMAGRYDEARSALRRGIEIARSLGDRVGLSGALEYVANYRHLTGDDRLAVRALGCADTVNPADVTRQARGAVVIRELVEALRASLGSETFAAEHKRGAAAPVDEIVRSVLN